MTLKVRRILSIIFILLFLAITPVIMLYAAGYRLGRNGLSFQRTGMFIIDSRPRGAKLFIDDQPLESWASSIFKKNNFIATPAKIKNLLPGEHNLKLELSGYLSWQKKLTINPGASTFAENIYLFKNDLPVQIAPVDIKSISLSPNKNQAVILSPDRLTFFNLADETEKSVGQNGLVGKNISWSGEQNKLVIDNYLYNLTNLSSKIDLKKLTANSFNYRWHGNILYYQDKNSIYELNSSGQPKKIISHKIFNDYLVKNGYLYLISQAGQTAKLEILDSTTGLPVKDMSLPAANYSFINAEQAWLNLYDNNHAILYLIDTLAAFEPLKEIINNVKTTFWVNANSLLYANDFEIWLYNLETKNKILITRISKIIKGAILHPSNDYIIYATEDTINAIELDEREKRNITELVKFDAIDSLTLNPGGEILYFTGKIGNSQGLYKFLIQ